MASAVAIALHPARRATCILDSLHGELLSVHEIGQIYPGAPKDTKIELGKTVRAPFPSGSPGSPGSAAAKTEGATGLVTFSVSWWAIERGYRESQQLSVLRYTGPMGRYHVAFYMPAGNERMV